MDRKELLRNIVRSKVPKNYPVIRALAKRAAVALLEKGIVERVAGQLIKSIPDRLEVMGVESVATIAYTQAAYVCIEITLLNVNLHTFLKYNANIKVADTATNLLEKYSIPAVNDAIHQFLLNFLAGKLLVQLPMTMKEKLYNKMAAEVELIPCSEEDQGPFLVQTIAQLNATHSKNNNTSSIPAGDDIAKEKEAS